MSGAEPNLPPARLTFRRDGEPTFNLFVPRAAFQPTVEEIRAAVADRNPPLTGEWVIGFWGDRDGFVTIDFDRPEFIVPVIYERTPTPSTEPFYGDDY